MDNTYFFKMGKALGISERNLSSLENYLALLKLKDASQYDSSLNVGLLGVEAGMVLGLDSKTLYFCGALHDIGKILIPSKVLNAKPFTEQDMQEIRKHPEFSYRLLMDIHPFSAEVALRHHQYQNNPYPEVLPVFVDNFSNETKKEIEQVALVVSAIDFYEACSRRNGRNKESELTLKERILKERPLAKDITLALFEHKVFTELN